MIFAVSTVGLVVVAVVNCPGQSVTVPGVWGSQIS